MSEPEDTEDVSENVSTEVAHAAWAVAARDLLIGTAGRYHQVITVKDLAAGAQERTHLTSTRRTHQWIGDVLDLVAAECVERGEPNLTSLCVNAEGGVGASYARSVTAATGEEPTDPDAHAATTRLACYVHFDATGLPANGGVAVLTPKLSASRSRLRKAALDARAVDTCPRCYIELPAQGGCNNCD